MSEMKEKFKEIRKYTEDLCSPLKIEDYVPQPVYYTSPPKWHLGHTSWFFEEFVLKNYVPNYELYHPKFSFLFNSYYNTVGDRVIRAKRGALSRPTVDEVYMYRKHVDQAILNLLDGFELSKGLAELIELGLNHEQQHQELLLTDIKFIFGHNPLYPSYSKEGRFQTDFNLNSGFLQIPTGLYKIGYKAYGFCFDNELANHTVHLNEFEISHGLVTNGDFLDFIEDQGYKRFDLWQDEGWTWLRESNINSPLYWLKEGDKWYRYSLYGLDEIKRDEILSHVNFYEASAFAEWKNMRLPTEFEWEAAADQLNWGIRWEWTNSAYLPYPGYLKASGAVGEYNGKFMVNQMVLRGASIATSPGHSRKTYRNFFHPHFQWQFTGIRLAKK